MRNKNKMLTVRSRKANATKASAKTVYFCKDTEVSSRILAVLYKEVSKNEISIIEPYIVEVKQKDGTIRKVGKHRKTGKAIREIERFKVICGSNGKVGTRYNTLASIRDVKRGLTVTEAEKAARITVGEKLTNKEFVEMYLLQCEVFKNTFKEEYNSIADSLKKKAV